MEFTQAVQNRYSCKKFDGRPVEKAKLEARKSKTKPIDIQGLIAKVEVIRAMTTMNQADLLYFLNKNKIVED